MPIWPTVPSSLRAARILGAVAFGLLLAHVEPTRAGGDPDLPASPTVSPLVDARSPWTISGFGTLGVVDRRSAANWHFQRSSNQPGASRPLSLTPDTAPGSS